MSDNRIEKGDKGMFKFGLALYINSERRQEKEQNSEQ